MAERATLARPYAKAAFAHARDHAAFDLWSKALQTGAAIVSDDRVATLLNSPKVGVEAVLELLSSGGDDAIGAHLQNLLRLLAKNGRLKLLPEIAAQFESLRAGIENSVDVKITSAVALNVEQRDRLCAALRKRLRREVKVTTAVDANLVGGAVIRAGDLVIDGSLKGRLERLRTELSH